MDINRVDMSQLYFMLGISNFDRLLFFWYRYTVDVCDWNVNMYMNLA
jgi:hypothetical protein